jgi:DNA (cytosine-5)-methyltransferase 1
VRVIDLFCGCGGLSSGFARRGAEILAGVDINPVPLRTYSRNVPDALALQADLSLLDPHVLLERVGVSRGELDCLIGGPPCQGFSKNVPASHRFFEDPRNLLILRFLTFVDALQPRVVLIENVAEMKNAYGRAYAEEITGVLQTLGYVVTSGILNAADFGVPQTRRRAFFFAAKAGVVRLPEPTRYCSEADRTVFNWGSSRGYATVEEAIGDLPSLQAGEGISPCAYGSAPLSEYQKLMRDRSSLLYDHVARPLRDRQLARVRSLTPGEGGGVDSLPPELRPKKHYSGAYARLRPLEPAPTITRWVFHPGSGRFYHPYDYRVITIREAARLQSFADDFIFEGTYIQKSHQVGEAVPPLLGAAFAEVARDLLG